MPVQINYVLIIYASSTHSPITNTPALDSYAIKECIIIFVVATLITVITVITITITELQ